MTPATTTETNPFIVKARKKQVDDLDLVEGEAIEIDFIVPSNLGGKGMTKQGAFIERNDSCMIFGVHSLNIKMNIPWETIQDVRRAE